MEAKDTHKSNVIQVIPEWEKVEQPSPSFMEVMRFLLQPLEVVKSQQEGGN
jgi:hypothetical protein